MTTYLLETNACVECLRNGGFAHAIPGTARGSATDVASGFPTTPRIAAMALANGLTVVTHNTAEFSRVSGLLIEDWHT